MTSTRLDLMDPYLNLCERVLTVGSDRGDRTGTGTRAIFGAQMNFDLRHGFPLLTNKKTNFDAIAHELLWFVSGDCDSTDYLRKNGVKIWDEWADANGELGPIYGVQWRSWMHHDPDSGQLTTYDQLEGVIHEIRKNPESRRLIVSAWNVGDLEDMALVPCHVMFQFCCFPMSWRERRDYLLDKGDFADLWADHIQSDNSVEGAVEFLDAQKVPSYYLDLQMYQRSADLFLGVPFNIASYALLQTMVAQVTGMVPRNFIHTIGDAHVYHNHFDQVRKMLSLPGYSAPTLTLDPEITDIDDFTFEDISLEGYQHGPFIKAPIAV